MAIVYLGVDLAKSLFALHGVDEGGKPALVRPSVPRGKNDAADAAAICEAEQRPNLRFVPIKGVEQQGQLCLHRLRQGFIEQRTACINRSRPALGVRHRAADQSGGGELNSRLLLPAASRQPG